MKNHCIKPDLRIRNAWIILTRRFSRICLSCKDYPQGIVPQTKGFYYAGQLIGIALTAATLPLALQIRDLSVPLFGKSASIVLLVVFLFVCEFIYSLIAFYITMRFGKWEPSKERMGETIQH